MKNFVVFSLFFVLFVHFTVGAVIEDRRLREGNAFARRLRSCNLFCSLKGSIGSTSTTRCFKIRNQNNVVVTDCAFRCLRLKGESPTADECTCINGVCLDDLTTSSTSPSTPSSATAVSVSVPASPQTPASSPQTPAASPAPQQPVAPVQLPAVPAQQPVVPAQQPVVPAQQPAVPAQQPAQNAQQPADNSQQPVAPAQQTRF